MSRVGRGVAAALGVVGLAAAAAVVVAPAAGEGVSAVAAALLALAGNDYVLAAVVAAAALAVVAALVGLRGVGGVDAATPPNPETVQSAPRPGDEFDRAVGTGSNRWRPSGDVDREAVRERLRRAAVRSTAHRDDLSRDEAAARVGDGAWTDDRVAAAFLADGGGGPTRRLLGLVPGGWRFRRDARRTVDVLCRREGVEGGRR